MSASFGLTLDTTQKASASATRNHTPTTGAWVSCFVPSSNMQSKLRTGSSGLQASCYPLDNLRFCSFPWSINFRSSALGRSSQIEKRNALCNGLFSPTEGCVCVTSARTVISQCCSTTSFWNAPGTDELVRSDYTMALSPLAAGARATIRSARRVMLIRTNNGTSHNLSLRITSVFTACTTSS